MMRPDTAGIGYGISYVRCLIPERNLLTILVLMYIPVMFLWRVAGRFGGKEADDNGQPSVAELTLLSGAIGEVDSSRMYLSEHQTLAPDNKSGKQKRKHWQTTDIMHTVMGINLIKPYLERMWKAGAWQWLWKGQKRYQHRRVPNSTNGVRVHSNFPGALFFWNHLMAWIWWDQSTSAYICDGSHNNIPETYRHVLGKYNRRVSIINWVTISIV